MSHYAVAVITKTNKNLTRQIEELLEPYNENMEVDPYMAKTKEEALAEIESHRDFIKEKGLDYDSKTDQEKIEDWFGYKLFDEHGNPLTTYNPNSKWDWYSFGGRFSGLLKANKGEWGQGSAFSENPMKDGEFDSARIGDIDFSMDMEDYYKAMRWWDVVIDDMPLVDGENENDFRTFYKKEYFLDRYKTKENYAKICSLISTYAVVTPDGKWHSKGEMGWWACSSETGDESLDWDLNWYNRFIKTADPDWYITIVDCHI